MLFTVFAPPPRGSIYDVSQSPHGLVRLVGDFAGEANFNKPNLLASPLRTMVQFNDSMLPVPCVSTSVPSVKRQSAQEGGSVVVSLSFSAARNMSGVHVEVLAEWTLELKPNTRWLVFNASGASTPGLFGAYHSIDFAPRSITALYGGGVTQMMNQDGWMGYRGSRDRLESLFAAGPSGHGTSSASGCVEVLRAAAVCSAGNFAASAGCSLPSHWSSSSHSSLLRDHDGTFLVSTPLTSGFREILVGYVSAALPALNSWGAFNFSAAPAGCRYFWTSKQVRLYH